MEEHVKALAAYIEEGGIPKKIQVVMQLKKHNIIRKQNKKK